MRRALLLATFGAYAISCNAILGHRPGTLEDASVCEGGMDDPHSCGACGHDCLGGGCAQGKCLPVVLASGLDYSSALAIDDAGAYWVNYYTPSVAKLRKDGTCDDGSLPGDPGCPSVLAPTSTFNDVARPSSIASDGTNVFFSNYDSVALRQDVVQISPSGAFTVLGSSLAPNIVVAKNGLVFWTSHADASGVMRATTSAPNSGAPLALHEPAPDGGTAIHTSAGVAADDTRVYWVVADTGAVFTTPMSTPCVEESTCTKLFTDVTGPGASQGPFTLAVGGATLYWSNLTDRTIKAMPKDGSSAPTTLVTDQGQVQALTVIDGVLFWGSFEDSTIRTTRATDPPCDKTTCTILAPDQVFPAGIAADALAIYWTTQRASGTVLTKSGALTKLAR